MTEGCQVVVGWRWWHPSEENITCDEPRPCEIHEDAMDA